MTLDDRLVEIWGGLTGKPNATILSRHERLRWLDSRQAASGFLWRWPPQPLHPQPCGIDPGRRYANMWGT